MRFSFSFVTKYELRKTWVAFRHKLSQYIPYTQSLLFIALIYLLNNLSALHLFAVASYQIKTANEIRRASVTAAPLISDRGGARWRNKRKQDAIFMLKVKHLSLSTCRPKRSHGITHRAMFCCFSNWNISSMSTSFVSHSEMIETSKIKIIKKRR